MTSQSDMFLEGEGDNYFRRNKPTLDSVVTAYGNETSEVDWLCRALTPFQEQIHSVLEIGCANGAKLERMCSALGAKGAGIDPSALAVADGNQRLQDGKIRLHTGTASSLPFEPQSFDFVYFGFCLYLLDRHDLFPAMSEADRVLKNGGFIAITDFDPIQQHKRPYHHKEGIFSYKQDYSKLLLGSGMYFLVSKTSFSHRWPYFDADGGERVSTSLLFKEIDAY